MAERTKYTTEQAVAMLPDGDDIHTLRGGGMMLLGADWGRAEIIAVIEKYGAERAGHNATTLGHGLCVIDDHGALFIATKPEENRS